MKKKINVSLINSAIRDRNSTVLFSSKNLTEEQLFLLFEAARWAPSSHNQQPWRYIYGIKGRNNAYNMILDSLNDANVLWAQNAPVLIVSIAESISSYNNKPNKYAWHDTGMANANLMNQAVTIGLHSHPMGGFDAQKIMNSFHLQEGLEPVCIIAVGYKNMNTKDFAKELVQRENGKRTRKETHQFVLDNVV